MASPGAGDNARLCAPALFFYLPLSWLLCANVLTTVWSYCGASYAGVKTVTDQGGQQPDRIQLQLIGPVQVFSSNGINISPRSKKAQALLGILALSPPGPVPRSRLAALLWERAEPDQARSLLRGAVHETQTSLRRANSEIIEAGREHLLLRRDKVDIDIDALFLQPSSLTQQSVLRQREAPPLLEGLEAIGPVFNAWLSTARLRFRERVRRELADRQPAEQDHSASQKVADRPALVCSRRDERPSGQAVRGLPSTGLPKNERGRSGVRIGVAPVRSFGSSEHDVLPVVLADEISGALAQFRWMSVLPSGTLPAVLPQGGNIAAAAGRLGLDYVVDGQLRSIGERVQLRMSLISVHEQAIVSTFRVEKAISEVLMFQDDVAAQVAASVDTHVQVLESRRAASQPDSADAHGLLMQAVAAVCRLDQMSFARASALLDDALGREPDHVSARVGSAQLQMVAASQGWVEDPRAALKRAEEDALIALSLDPFDARALTISGHVQTLLYRQPGDAVGLHRRALELNSGLPFALHFSAANALMLGDLAQARTSLERHRQLVSPSGQHLFVNSATILLHLLEGDYEAAVRVSRAVLHLNANFVAAYKPYLAALGHLGYHSEAKAARAKLLELNPSFTAKTFLASTPFRRSQDSERYTAGLRRAGLA